MFLRTTILTLIPLLALGQGSKTPIYNGILQSNLDANGFSIVNAAGGGGGAAWGSITGTLSAQTDLNTALTGKQPLDSDLTTWAGLTPSANFQTLVPQTFAQMRTSMAVQATNVNLDTWATLAPSANFQTMVPHTFSQMRTDLSLVPGTNVEVPLTFSTGLTRSTNTVTVNSSQSIATLSNLTTNGFVKTGGAVGTLSVDTATYQASDADLTTWAGITPVAAVGTWIATPSSANLRGAVTDENGTGALLFSGATTPDFTTGFTIGAAAASGKIPIGNGTNYVPSTPTFSNAPSTALKWMRSDGTNWITSTSLLSDTPSTAGKILRSDGTNWITSTPTFPTAAGAVGYTIRSDATNFASYPAQLVNSSVTAQSPSSSDVYLAGSAIVVTAGDFKAGGQYKCVFDMTKSAGTGAIVITLRVGTGTGAVGDAAIQTYTFGAGTSVADFGMFEVVATWRTVGSGTSAVIQGMCRGTHQLATTGLFNNAAGWMVLGSPSPSSGFNSSTGTVIGLSFNGSTAFAGTTQVVQAQLQQ